MDDTLRYILGRVGEGWICTPEGFRKNTIRILIPRLGMALDDFQRWIMDRGPNPCPEKRKR